MNNLIPTPNGKLVSGGQTALNQAFTLHCCPPFLPCAQLLQQRLAPYGAQLMVECPPRTEESGASGLLITLREESPVAGGPSVPGWYRLEMDDTGIRAGAAALEGAYAACVSLYHLLRQALPTGRLQQVSFSDWPRYEHRGLHLDTARHYFAPDEIEKLIEQIALLKMNVLHWHFADDQAWRIESKRYPRLTQRCGARFYTQSEVTRIVRYAAARGVQILPEFEIPGHNSAAIAAYPELSCRGAQIEPPATGGIYKTILCGGKPEAYLFIETILNELLPLFPGPLVHLGGDEAPKTEWSACPHCAAMLQKQGLRCWEELQGHMLNFAAGVVKAHGKAVICWNECLKADNLDVDIAIQYWTEMPSQDYCAQKIAAGRRTVFSNASRLYLDYPHSLYNLKWVYAHTPKAKKQDFSDAPCVMGVECAVWTERIDTNSQLEAMLFPRVVAVAETAWSKARDYEGFRGRLAAYYPLLEQSGINATPLKKAQVHGLARLWENIQFFAMALGYLRQIKKAGGELS